MSVADEAIKLQIDRSGDELQEAILSYGRSVIISAGADSLEESRPKGDGPSRPADGYPEDRLLEAKAAMKMTASELPGDLSWNIETLISEAVTETLEDCKLALGGEK